MLEKKVKKRLHYQKIDLKAVKTNKMYHYFTIERYVIHTIFSYKKYAILFLIKNYISNMNFAVKYTILNMQHW